MPIHLDLLTVGVGAAASVFASFLIAGLLEWLRSCDVNDSEEVCAQEKSDGRLKVFLSLLLLFMAVFAFAATRGGRARSSGQTESLQESKGRLQGGQALTLFVLPRLVSAALPSVSNAVWPRVRSALPRSVQDLLPSSLTAEKPRRASPCGTAGPRGKSARAPRSGQPSGQTPCS